MDGDGSHEIIRCLLLGRKVMTNLENILKSKGIPLLTKVPIIKAVVFPVVMYVCMYVCEIWTIKKAEHQRIDALKNFFYVFLFVNVTLFIYWPHSMVCGILVP